ncbi:NAD(+) diphosphatase [Hyphobacterium sp.]|jgi:NAD+ diphosphatase|uniref:NAD(+) diphosphatase n=1 Tax=Hyphobacterium sp. TaxID=2004662 RepID=UPI003BAD6AC8
MNQLPPLAFCGSPLDRAEDLRRSDSELAALAQQDAAGAILFLKGCPAITTDHALLRWPLAEALALPHADEPILLGLEDGAPLYVVDLDPGAAPPEEARFVDTRMAALQLPIDETGILAHARSLVEWRRKHRFCSNCGSKTRQIEAGRKRACPDCGTEHFPRVDPVAIMLVVKDDWCLLGRQEGWPPRMWSALAGFMEPGETIAQAAAREVYEEAGLTADPATAQLIADQPWPFASSLMLGLIIDAITVDITIDTHEIEDARWFSKDEVRAMLNGAHPEADIPPKIAIARRLLEVWAG